MALIKLSEKRNSTAMRQISVADYIEKMTAHWWMQEFPDFPVPFETKRWDEDLDFVQTD